MLKKIIPKLLFIAIILATLTACGNGNSSSGENTMAGTSSVTQEAVTDSQPVTLEYILSHTDLSAEDFSGIDINAFMNRYGLDSGNIDENLNLIPDLIKFYRDELAAEPTIDYSVIYQNSEGTLSEQDLDKLDALAWDYHEGNFNQYMVIDFSSGKVYSSWDEEVIVACNDSLKVADLTQEDRDWLKDILLQNEVASWKNEYEGTNEDTTGHHSVGFAFRLTDGRCVSYVAYGVINPNMPMQMEVLSDALRDRFGSN